MQFECGRDPLSTNACKRHHNPVVTTIVKAWDCGMEVLEKDGSGDESMTSGLKETSGVLVSTCQGSLVTTGKAGTPPYGAQGP